MEIATVATADVLARAVVNQPPLRVRYKIEFPPGAMGVELEPVIRSSEKEIGCRVKDYYFPLDHNGVDRHYVESRVAIGDIICSINGEDVKSQSFGLIVDKLKSLKDKRRVISFKNIGASCNVFFKFFFLIAYSYCLKGLGNKREIWMIRVSQRPRCLLKQVPTMTI